jgi:hypothetical protein
MNVLFFSHGRSGFLPDPFHPGSQVFPAFMMYQSNTALRDEQEVCRLGAANQ